MDASSDRTEQSPTGAHRPMLCGEEVPKAGHICAFFSSEDEKYEVLSSYFADAIQSGDRVVDVVEAARYEEHLRGMVDAGVDMRTALESGQLRLATCEDIYFRDGRLELDAVLDMLRAELQATREEGACLRTSGEMNWVARDPAVRDRAMEYEARVNQLMAAHECTMLCVYDLAATPSSLISDILATHPYAVVNGRLRPNPWAVDPEAFLQMRAARAVSRNDVGTLS